MLKVKYSPAALEDLQQIRDYILDNWGESVATKVLKKITSDIRRLEQYPLSGVDLGKIIDVPTEYRYLFSEKNYVFFRIELDIIRIVRVLNERQNYMQQLFGISSESKDN
ncbi:type II toxin-antitoxin system RelE/ParE family toxin [Bacillus sp. REN16]|uniref:type II toxin-antitoxin system RelE/ParE family toxin n=1 Tax=Bacillus sp. REN16 TaxID=2887296 RepID=UPI001E53A78B|nr:type II toxin-antitoxin system RelE/ParE family toxin [Bacillus sp. REN16]MCC3357770.1 type II toxin-antitoxin system RelE/ParE family toxin [Bacillus sp. REN16]